MKAITDFYTNYLPALLPLARSPTAVSSSSATKVPAKQAMEAVGVFEGEQDATSLLAKALSPDPLPPVAADVLWTDVTEIGYPLPAFPQPPSSACRRSSPFPPVVAA